MIYSGTEKLSKSYEGVRMNYWSRKVSWQFSKRLSGDLSDSKTKTSSPKRPSIRSGLLWKKQKSKSLVAPPSSNYFVATNSPKRLRNYSPAMKMNCARST